MTHDEIRRHELSDFLRTRRARISPADNGFPVARRRRTPGLRREEVAQLAGMSATWYTWLEQRRPIGVSHGMLDNLARVLQLNPAERIQLFRLARRVPIIASVPERETISPRFQRMLDQADMPAFVMGRRWDVLGWNLAARAFLFDFEQVPPDERNLIWLIFTYPALRSLLVEWSTRAQDTLARFRADYGRYAGDSQFVQLVGRLNAVSPEFAQWWPRHDVQPLSEGCLPYNHPLVGRMIVDHMTFSLVDNPELRVNTLLPTAEANSIKKMRKIIAAFRSGSRPARGVSSAAITAKSTRLRARTTSPQVPTPQTSERPNVAGHG
jgi:transcriptional regulator with XRE-family HTH domain